MTRLPASIDPAADSHGHARVLQLSQLGVVLALALIVLLAASKSILFDTLDPDSFWHLRVADQLLHDGIGPIVDHLSFMSISRPWTPYSWLAELAMRGLWAIGGYRAAIATQAINIAAIYTLLAVSCRRREASTLSTLLLCIAGVYLSLPYLSFRPATMSIALVALGLWLLIRDRQLNERSRTVWALVPLTILTVNVHLFAFLLPACVGGLLAGAVIERRNVRRYALLLVLCSLACLCTPMLPGLIATMWHYQTADAMVAGPGIAELRPIYAGPMGVVTVLLVASGLVGCVMHRKRLRAGDWFWLIGAVALLLRMGRFAPLFVIIAGPIIASAGPRGDVRALERPMPRWSLALLLIGGVVRMAVGFPSRALPLDSWVNRMGPDTPGYPCAAADFVQTNITPTSGHVLNEFTWGGYLAWRLGPQFQTFMDGRTQLYSASFWRSTCMAKPTDFRNYLAHIPADAAIVPADHGPMHDAVIALGWKCVYADDRAAVYVPPVVSAAAE